MSAATKPTKSRAGCPNRFKGRVEVEFDGAQVVIELRPDGVSIRRRRGRNKVWSGSLEELIEKLTGKKYLT